MSNILPSPICRLAAYHILLYGALLGTELYQSLVNTKVAFRTIPMPQFPAYQKTIFPIYFQLQAALIPLVAITYPRASVAGLLREKGLWAPLAVAMGCAVGNCFVWGPRCVEAMLERAHQRACPDGSANALDSADRAFSANHAMAIHLNFVAVVCTIWYGFALGSRITIKGTETV